MNKIIFSVLVSGTALLALNSPISGQESMSNNQATLSPTPTPTIVRYDLAFPGILPDNPLYKLKVLRDKISEALISDPKKKIEFYLLQADKGILASAILIDKHKIDLAAQTALKAEHNYTLITQELYSLQKKPAQAFFDKLEKAALKHQEILSSLGMRVTEDKRKIFFTVADFSKRNWQTVKMYQRGQ